MAKFKTGEPGFKFREIFYFPVFRFTFIFCSKLCLYALIIRSGKEVRPLHGLPLAHHQVIRQDKNNDRKKNINPGENRALAFDQAQRTRHGADDADQQY
ncbi:MAG TPA: hypothetical protein VIH86_08350 [Puia sp.]